MIELKELDKTIDYLKTLRDEEEKRQFDNLSKEIKKELISQIRDALVYFESKTMKKYLEDTEKAVAYDYPFMPILKFVEDNINVEVWEVK